jgi:PHD/YefM family antitoxin component YafN of YafNO toxin-antitoxin module
VSEHQRFLLSQQGQPDQVILMKPDYERLQAIELAAREVVKQFTPGASDALDALRSALDAK